MISFDNDNFAVFNMHQIKAWFRKLECEKICLIL